MATLSAIACLARAGNFFGVVAAGGSLSANGNPSCQEVLSKAPRVTALVGFDAVDLEDVRDGDGLTCTNGIGHGLSDA